MQKCMAAPGRSPSAPGVTCECRAVLGAVVPPAPVVCGDDSELFPVSHGPGDFNSVVSEGG